MPRVIRTRRARPALHTLARAAAAASLVGHAAAATAQDASAAPAPAPPAGVHQGFWIGFGAGTGRLLIDCAECGPAPLPRTWRGGRGGGGYVALGGTLRPNLLLGGEMWLAMNSLEERGAAVSQIGVVAQVYMPRVPGVFVRAGGGIGVALLTDSSLGFPSGQDLATGGPSIRAGLGYDLDLGGRVTLAPYVDFVQTFASGTPVTVRGLTYRGPKNPAAAFAGLSLNWY